MKKIRVVYTIPNFDTAGSGIALLKLASHLDRSRFEPVIVCQHDRGAFFETVRRSGIPVHVYPYLTAQHPRWRFAFRILRIAAFFRSLRPDIIFSYHYASDISEAIAARLSGCRFAYVKKNMGWYGPSWKQWRIKTRLAHAITVQNTDMLEFFSGSHKARLISIGVDPEEFKPSPPEPELRAEWVPDSSDKVVLCVANLVPKKGIGFLIEGFSRSAYRGNARLLIAGNHRTELWEETCTQVRELGLEERVLFTGKRKDVARFYAIADLFILPSTGDEGAPIVIQEAMASGVPVVTTAVPGNRDQLADMSGQLIPPCDADAIAAAIDRFLGMDRERIKDIVARQIDVVNRRYSLQHEVVMHERLYQELMDHRQPKA